MSLSTHHHAVVAVDTGGTFTDLSALFDDGRQVRVKVPSTPADPSQAVLHAIDELRAIEPSVEVTEIRHGTTVATNALLERRGADVVLVTTAGFEDLLILRRQNRPDLYALHPTVAPPLVPPARCLGISERMGPSGCIVTKIEPISVFIERFYTVLSAAESIAICLLHSYANPEHERLLGDELRATFNVPVTLSSSVAPVVREFERCSTAVVNAYVAPVMQKYLHSLALAVAPTPLHVMASGGGLMPVAAAVENPVQTALSGPAGGVAGAWAAGLRCGRPRLLTLDMGGTSTDVSVVEQQLQPSDDGAIGGHPLRVAMLPIETVGAGGGSIAYVDVGGALRVGPRSAGSRPGPACYGFAGATAEPTVTDAHVVLGRLPSLLGGQMQLHADLARAAVTRLSVQMNATVQQTAAAIIATATATMARACKRVSMQRGVDPRGLSVVAFGGAGALHACELAEEMGCTEVIVPAGAGVLSADGIVHCAPQVDVAITVMRLLANFEAGGLTELILGQQHAALEKLSAQWKLPTTDDVIVSGWLDTRYAGQTFTLPIALQDVQREGLQVAFVDAHQQRYGYAVKDRDIELVAVRISATLSVAELASGQAERSAAIAAKINGPVAVAAYDYTLWLPDGWSAKSLSTGDVLCTRDPSSTRDAQAGSVLGLEIHRQRMEAIAEQMGAVLMSAAFSANIKERKDYSCAIFDSAGRMLCHAAHIPVHLGSTPMSVAAVVAAVPMRRGAAVMVNDPFAGGTHLPDVTVVTAVFLDEDAEKPSFLVANRAHHADVGGISPGSMPAPFAADSTVRRLTIDDEGVRLPPTVITPQVRARFAAASRTPSQRLGDLRAQEAANRTGAELLAALVQEQGAAVVDANNTALLNYAERRMRSAITALPDGEFRFEDHLDNDGTSSTPVRLAAVVRISGDTAEVDFRDSDDAGPGPLNAVRAIAVSAVFYVFRAVAGAMSDGDAGAMPANEGMMRPITVLTRPSSILDAQHPSAVSSGNVETSQRVVDTLLGALAKAAPRLIPAASCGSMNNVLMGGQSPQPWVHYETLAGGAGGGPLGDGASAIHSHMTNTLNTPVESLEHAFAIRIERYHLAPPSAAASSRSGGAGVVRAYRFLEPTEVTLITERRTLAPWGSNGAASGMRGVNTVIHPDSGREVVSGKCSLTLGPEHVLEIQTPGGGGWNEPVDREKTPS